jgi:hypothetical protein
VVSTFAWRTALRTSIYIYIYACVEDVGAHKYGFFFSFGVTEQTHMSIHSYLIDLSFFMGQVVQFARQ